MSKGILGENNWYVAKLFDSNYTAERITKDDEREYHEINAHCLACAKTEVLMKYGGSVDLRGWHNQGICGVFLLATVTSMESEDDNEKIEGTRS